MKLLSSLALSTLLGFAASPLMAAEQPPALTGCAAKRQAISEQIEQARAHGNANQQAGLEKALAEVTEHCTDSALRKEREQKVLDARHEERRPRAHQQAQGQAGRIEERAAGSG